MRIYLALLSFYAFLPIPSVSAVSDLAPNLPQAICETCIAALGYSAQHWANRPGYELPCVHPLFEKTPAGWIAVGDPNMSKEPRKAKTWRVYFDGKVRTELALEKKELDLCFVKDKNPEALKLFAARSALRLNLFAVTKTETNDPAQWSRFEPSAEQRNRAKDAFIGRFQNKHECKPTKGDPDWGEVAKTSQTLKREELTIESRAFRNRAGAALVGVSVKGKHCLTDTHSVNEYYQKHWYFLNQGKTEEVLGEGDSGTGGDGKPFRMLSVIPIEAGDFDGDGRTEWLFRHNSANAGSVGSQFILTDDHFRALQRAYVSLPAFPGEESE